MSRMTAYFADQKIEDLPADKAWKMLEVADKEQDLDDIKMAMLAYAKAYPEVTFEDLEQVFRDFWHEHTPHCQAARPGGHAHYRKSSGEA